MAGSDQMPKVNFNELPPSVKQYAELFEKNNIERARKLKILRTRNLRIGGILAAGVIGIYSYSILAVKQETFLDDFNEPAREKV